ncbi:ABC transporter ATP-binding protein [Desulfurivibrio sp. D14AmB]|uniref:ABC transporter ATP-binding protein n=1 Tax=Desulfurivibrio sp. D14AmB TaxID=3374370 RepID=UPI00376EF3A5
MGNGIDQQGFLLQNLSFDYEGVAVLHDISLELPPGRFYGIVGPNGCGKTTLLDLLTGSRRSRRGQVWFRGREIGSYRRRRLARELALVPQEYAIGFAFTVEEVVLMGRHPHLPRFAQPGPADWRLVEEAMAEIGIDHLRRRLVTELSGGEKQRVAVARALAQQTPVLLLDEATASLDVRYSLGILGALAQRVRRRGDTVIAVLHDLNLAASFCDQLLFLHRGRIADFGPTDQVLTPANIRRVFGVESAVDFDGFSGRQRVSFRLEQEGTCPLA